MLSCREQFAIRISKIEKLFNNLMSTNSRVDKRNMVNDFKIKHPKMVKDLDYCFEVLSGKHKLGYTLQNYSTEIDTFDSFGQKTIKGFVENVLKHFGQSEDEIYGASLTVPKSARWFMCSLMNRDYRLGFSNKENMIENTSPMLAKKYPDDLRCEQFYYVQEKLDGNRCIAYWDDGWKFKSRSGKPLNVNFDMSWANECDIFDGEIMTLGHAGTRDFNVTSGAINGKFTDKSSLHYYIYDIITEEPIIYEKRKAILDEYSEKGTGKDCSILPVLDKVYVFRNTDYNENLDKWLDYIVDKGGEGVMLRDPNAYYQSGKRCDALLKYKKLQTMDLRIVGWNYGKEGGKYENAIGSFICKTDDESIIVNVSGMSDEIRFSNPNKYIGKIIEVAYFSTSKSKSKSSESLRFPRLKRFRDDKNETSIY